MSVYECSPPSLPPLSLGGFPTLYTVEVKERLEDWTANTVIRTNTTDLSLVLTDLEPLTRYNARVRSQNFNGFSAFSEAEDFSTFGVFLCASVYLWYSLWYIHYSPSPPPSFPHLPLTPSNLGDVTVTGSNGMVESETTIILVCTQMLLTGDDTCITVEYTWSREGGQALPDGSMISNGEPSLSPSYLQPSLTCPLHLNLTSYSTILHRSADNCRCSRRRQWCVHMLC